MRKAKRVPGRDGHADHANTRLQRVRVVQDSCGRAGEGGEEAASQLQQKAQHCSVSTGYVAA